jgi:hypothetical protein
MSSDDTRITFECECGASLRAPATAAGRNGTCKTCGRRVTIPFLAEASAQAIRPAPAQPAAARPGPLPADICSICQSAIGAQESTTSCTECGLPFHEECWAENLGCSAYGCSQVNALRTGPDIRVEVPPPLPGAAWGTASTPAPAAADIPWEYLLLAATAVASLLGLVCFGFFPFLTGAAAGVYLGVVRQGKPTGVLVACLAMSFLGFVAGIILSFKFWQ